MRALLIKDLYSVWGQGKILFLIIAIFAVLPGDGMAAFAVFYAATLPVTAIGLDENSRWDRMAAMMPFSRWELVFSKYLMGYMCVMGVTALSFIVRAAAGVMGGAGLGSLTEEALSLLVSACASLVIIALMLPLMFRYGTVKGRLAMVVLIGALMAGAAVGSAKNLMARLDLGIGMETATLIMATGAAILNLLSVPVSVALYGRRER